jgi:hypothetical protein
MQLLRARVPHRLHLPVQGLTRWLSDWISPMDVLMKAQPISMGKPPMQDASQS